MQIRRATWVLVIVLCSLPVAAWAAGSDLSQLVGKAEHVILLRHARAPGTGDPPNFRLGDCSTQRNLSKAGRDQAVRIGARLRAAGLASTTVYSSQWCRCLETARNLAVGPVVELPALNSFFQSPELEQKHTRPLRSWIASADLGRPVVLVTHQVNITALTGVVPAEGEILIGEDYLQNRNKSIKISYLRKQAKVLGFDLVSSPSIEKKSATYGE